MTLNTEPAAEPGARPQLAAAAPLFPDLTRDDVFRLETRRLWLRWPRLSDLPQLKAFAGLKEVAEMTATWPHPLPEGEAERRIFEARKGNATGAGLVLAITPRHKPTLQIGTVALTPGPSPTEAELGYMLHPDHRGQGLVVEAAQALLNAAFTYTAIQSVSAWARVINPASRRVLEKCGFRHVEALMRHQPARGGMLPCDRFVIDRKTWSALRAWGSLAPVRAEPDGLRPDGAADVA